MQAVARREEEEEGRAKAEEGNIMSSWLKLDCRESYTATKRNIIHASFPSRALDIPDRCCWRRRMSRELRSRCRRRGG